MLLKYLMITLASAQLKIQTSSDPNLIGILAKFPQTYLRHPFINLQEISDKDADKTKPDSNTLDPEKQTPPPYYGASEYSEIKGWCPSTKNYNPLIPYEARLRKFAELSPEDDIGMIGKEDGPKGPGCGSSVLFWANEVYEEGLWTGQFKNYPYGACGYVNDFAEECETEGLFSVQKIYYCSFQENLCTRMGTIIFFIPGILIGMVGMFILSSTADNYLSPPVEYIVDFTNMSQSLAGVTLLAFSAGAPDVFSSIAAGGDENDGAIKGITPIQGSTFFIQGFVIFLVFRANNYKEIAVTKRFFIRDVAFYAIGLLNILMHIFIWRKTTFVQVALYFIIYISYIVVSVWQSKQKD